MISVMSEGRKLSFVEGRKLNPNWVRSFGSHPFSLSSPRGGGGGGENNSGGGRGDTSTPKIGVVSTCPNLPPHSLFPRVRRVGKPMTFTGGVWRPEDFQRGRRPRCNREILQDFWGGSSEEVTGYTVTLPSRRFRSGEDETNQ